MPTTITFSRSDGDPSTWPVCGEVEPGVYLDRLSQEDEYVVRFREKLASILIDLLNYPPEAGVTLRDLPDGYGLFCRRTEVSLKTRQDRYLRGSRNVKQFRSAAEFAPHAAWLLTDISLNPSNCECQYCSKKVNSRIRRSASATVHTSISTTGAQHNAPVMPLRTGRIMRTSSSLSCNSSGSKGSSSPDIYVRRVQPSRDDSQLHLAPPFEVTHLYRTQELVWLILENPIPVEIPGKSYLVRFWPGIVEGHNLSAAPTPGGDGVDPETNYHVKIVSLNRTYHVPQRFIAPFQTHSVEDEKLVQVRYERRCVDDLRGFDPFPQWLVRPGAPSPTSPPPAEPLLAVFSFDVRVAKMIASFWTVTESRDAGDTISPTGPHNPKTILQPPDAPPLNPTIADSVSHRRFWWGAERVQPGDLLRLSFTESGFKYTVAASACFADGLNSTTTASQTQSQGSMFLGLRTLIAVQGSPDKTKRSLHAAGQLYKLVPEISSAKSERPKVRDEVGLPQPPEGYAFHRILASDWEVQLSLRFVRGRYYPQLKRMLGDSTRLSSSLLQTMEGLAVCVTATPRYNVTESREETVLCFRSLETMEYTFVRVRWMGTTSQNLKVQVDHLYTELAARHS